MWSVSEVVRATLVPIVLEDVYTLEAEQPPPDSAIDVSRLARIRVNDLGDAEWAVLSGPNPRSDVIEPDEERQELAQIQARRKAADAKVDWSLARDAVRPPSFVYADGSNEGCWGPSMYGWSSDRTEAIWIRFDQHSLGANTFVIGGSSDLQVSIHVYTSPQRSWRMCGDVRMPGDLGEEWRAVSGTMSIELSPVFRVREPGTHRATIRINGAEFVSASGARVRQSQPITLSTTIVVPPQQ
jgi:hypothetical protein